MVKGKLWNSQINYINNKFQCPTFLTTKRLLKREERKRYLLYLQLWMLPQGSCGLHRWPCCWSEISWMVCWMRASYFQAQLVVGPAPYFVSCPSSQSRHTESLTSSRALKNTSQQWLGAPPCRHVPPFKQFWSSLILSYIYSVSWESS